MPKIDVDNLPRVLADSKRAFTQSYTRPSPMEELHTSASGLLIVHRATNVFMSRIDNGNAVVFVCTF